MRRAGEKNLYSSPPWTVSEPPSSISTSSPSSSSSMTSGRKLAVSPPTSPRMASSAWASRLSFMWTEKMSSSSSEFSRLSASLAATCGATSSSGRRVSLCWRLVLEKSGTYSKITLEFSRPYQRAGEPQKPRMRYLSSIMRWSKPDMSVSGESILRMRQKRKSPTVLRSR